MTPTKIKWYKRFLMAVAAFFGYFCATRFGNDAAGAFICYNVALFLLWATTFEKKPAEPPPGHRIPPFF